MSFLCVCVCENILFSEKQTRTDSDSHQHPAGNHSDRKKSIDKRNQALNRISKLTYSEPSAMVMKDWEGAAPLCGDNNKWGNQ